MTMKSLSPSEPMSWMVTIFGVVQRTGRFGFLNEAALAVRVGDLVRRKNLDGDRALELRISGFEDEAHAAFAQLRFDNVAANRLTDHLACLGRILACPRQGRERSVSCVSGR